MIHGFKGHCPAVGRPGTGAVDESRTRDLHLGKVPLYQLSYNRAGSPGLEPGTFALTVRRSAIEL